MTENELNEIEKILIEIEERLDAIEYCYPELRGNEKKISRSHVWDGIADWNSPALWRSRDEK